MWWRPSMADWGSCIFVVLHPISQAMDDRIMCHSIISSCQSAAISETAITHISNTIASTQTFTFTFHLLCLLQFCQSAFGHMKIVISISTTGRYWYIYDSKQLVYNVWFLMMTWLCLLCLSVVSCWLKWLVFPLRRVWLVSLSLLVTASHCNWSW